MSLNLTGTTEFKLNVTPKIMTFTDTTDYSGQSVSPSDAKGCLTIIGPTGTIYNNTNFGSPDILPGTTDFFDRNLPLNTSSEVVQGDYSVQYRVRIDNNITANITGTSIITVVGSDVSALFTNGTSFQITTGSSIGTYTVSSCTYVGTDTMIVIEESVLLENGVNILVYSYSTQNFNYNYCYGAPVVDIEAQVDCDCSKIVSRDLTNYNIQACGTTLVPASMLRVHTVSAPEGADGLPVVADVVSNLASVVVTPIWTKTWTTSIQTTLTYTLPSGLLVTMVASGQTEYVVDCAEGLCCVYACMANLRNTYERFLTTNPLRAVEFFPKVFKMTTAWMLYSVAHTCGDFANKRKYLEEIIDIAKSDNCDCCNGADDLVPVEIVPVCGAVSGGSGNTTIVTTCGNGITITPTTVGSTTTYQVCIDLTVLNQNIADYLLANPLALGDLSNVTIIGPDTNQVLVWNGTQWVNGSIPLGALSNVTAGSPGANQFLMWNGVSWVPADAPVTYSKAFLINSFTTAQTLSATGAFTDLDVQLPLATGNNALSANGDLVEFTMLFEQSSSRGNACGFALNGVFIAGRIFSSTGSSQQILLKGTLTRISATELHVILESDNLVQGQSASSNFRQVFYNTATVANIATTPLVISPWKLVNGGASECLYANYKSIKK